MTIVKTITTLSSTEFENSLKYYQKFGYTLYRTFNYGVWFIEPNTENIIEIIK